MVKKKNQTLKTQGANPTGHHQVMKTLMGCCPTGADATSNRGVGSILCRAQSALGKASVHHCQ